MDSDSDHSRSTLFKPSPSIGSGDEDIKIPYLFKSALDVGSYFVDIAPQNELTFISRQNSLISLMSLRNVTFKSHIAYFVRNAP